MLRLIGELLGLGAQMRFPFQHFRRQLVAEIFLLEHLPRVGRQVVY